MMKLTTKHFLVLAVIGAIIGAVSTGRNYGWDILLLLIGAGGGALSGWALALIGPPMNAWLQRKMGNKDFS